MSPLIPVIIRYTANTAMFLGVVVTLLAGWDYWRGPGAGQGSTLVGVLVGLLVFWLGFRSFRKLARETEKQAIR